MHEPLPGEDLTQNQRDALLIIQEIMADTGGIAPSYQELADEMDLASRSGVAAIVARLTKLGYIQRLPFRARAIQVLRPLPPPDDTPITWFPSVDLLAGQGEVAHG